MDQLILVVLYTLYLVLLVLYRAFRPSFVYVVNAESGCNVGLEDKRREDRLPTRFANLLAQLGQTSSPRRQEAGKGRGGAQSLSLFGSLPPCFALQRTLCIIEPPLAGCSAKRRALARMITLS
jgi:hypothetical protein